MAQWLPARTAMPFLSRMVEISWACAPCIVIEKIAPFPGASPCQFSQLPTDGTCEAVAGFDFQDGHYGDVKLGGLKAVGLYKWPGPIHEGNGEMQLILDDKATPEQRAALEAIKAITGAGDALRGRMLIFDGLHGETRTIRTARRKDCPVCKDAR